MMLVNFKSLDEVLLSVTIQMHSLSRNFTGYSVLYVFLYVTRWKWKFSLDFELATSTGA